jgi:hypothetical protein
MWPIARRSVTTSFLSRARGRLWRDKTPDRSLYATTQGGLSSQGLVEVRVDGVGDVAIEVC